MIRKISSTKETLKLLRLPIYGSSLIIGVVAIAILLTGGWVGLHKKWPVLLAVFCLMFLTLFILAIVDRSASRKNGTSKGDSENG